jgi:hypothetical protein
VAEAQGGTQLSSSGVFFIVEPQHCLSHVKFVFQSLTSSPSDGASPTKLQVPSNNDTLRNHTESSRLKTPKEQLAVSDKFENLVRYYIVAIYGRFLNKFDHLISSVVAAYRRLVNLSIIKMILLSRIARRFARPSQEPAPPQTQASIPDWHTGRIHLYQYSRMNADEVDLRQLLLNMCVIW